MDLNFHDFNPQFHSTTICEDRKHFHNSVGGRLDPNQRDAVGGPWKPFPKCVYIYFTLEILMCLIIEQCLRPAVDVIKVYTQY